MHHRAKRAGMPRYQPLLERGNVSERSPVVAALVEARGVSRVLPGPVPVTLNEDADLEIAAGQFVAITGPSGSGKSSLLYLLGLLDRPSAGEILISGRPTAGLDGDGLAALRLATIGFVFQFHFLLPEFSVLENITLPMRRLGRWRAAEMTGRADAILERLGLADKRDRLPAQLSGGERQRAAIARALANDPPLLLADEPTGNLDSRNAQAVFAIFAELAAEGARAVVVVTHDLELARGAGRRIGLLDGRIREDTAG
jgi:lipoprotein-releasing system ATP-binding protein